MRDSYGRSQLAAEGAGRQTNIMSKENEAIFNVMIRALL